MCPYGAIRLWRRTVSPSTGKFVVCHNCFIVEAVTVCELEYDLKRVDSTDFDFFL